jgi:hypothetical protein
VVSRVSCWRLLETARAITCCPSAVLMVFVIRSGMDARRLAPMALSFMNPSTMVRGAKLPAHCALVSATPSHPSASISDHSSVAMLSVNTCTHSLHLSATLVASQDKLTSRLSAPPQPAPEGKPLTHAPLAVLRY